MSEPYISVIVCSYNGERCLKKTLDALYTAVAAGSLVKEVILVNNNSDDRTGEIMQLAAQSHANTRYVTERTQGLSAARLCGFNYSSGEWITYIDDDNYLDPAWFEHLNSAIEKLPDIGIIGGEIVPVLENSLTEENRIVLDEIYKSLAVTHLTRDEIEKNTVKKVNDVCGAGMAVNRKILEEIRRHGWLSLEGRKGKKLTSGEDTEICYAAQKMGYGIYRSSDLLIVHDIPNTRLTVEYAGKLMYGIYQAYFFFRTKNNGNKVLFRIGDMIKICLHKIWKPVLLMNHTTRNQLTVAINEAYDRVMIEYLFRGKR